VVGLARDTLPLDQPSFQGMLRRLLRVPPLLLQRQKLVSATCASAISDEERSGDVPSAASGRCVINPVIVSSCQSPLEACQPRLMRCTGSAGLDDGDDDSKASAETHTGSLPKTVLSFAAIGA
jgi:hypothetical protein